MSETGSATSLLERAEKAPSAFRHSSASMRAESEKSRRVQVAVDEVQVGMQMQLLVRDPATGRQALEADLKVILCNLHQTWVLLRACVIMGRQ